LRLFSTNRKSADNKSIRRSEQPSEKQRHPMYSWRENTLTHLGAAIGKNKAGNSNTANMSMDYSRYSFTSWKK
jgi:hypothetical protein